MKVYELLALLKTADPSDEVVIECSDPNEQGYYHRIIDADVRHKTVILLESVNLIPE